MTHCVQKEGEPVKRLLVGIALALIVAAPVSAAQPPASGNISLATAEPTYQQPVTFDWSVSGHYKAFYYPMIYVACYQSLDVNPYGYTTLPPNENGDYLVYGELFRPGTGYVPLLGGGSSAWVSNGGGAADCTATLYLYPGLHDAPIIFLDQTPVFSAAG